MKTCIRKYAGFACALLGICMMIAGSMRGEVSIVLTKAINICLECIGIG